MIFWAVTGCDGRGIRPARPRDLARLGGDLALDRGERGLDLVYQNAEMIPGLGDLVGGGRERPVDRGAGAQRLPCIVDQGADPVEVDRVAASGELAACDPAGPRAGEPQSE